MGMYTEFRIDCHLKADTPRSVIAVLDKLTNHRTYLPDNGSEFAEYYRSPEAAAFLDDGRWTFFGSGNIHSMFDQPCVWVLRNESTDVYYLSIGAEVKNYTDVIQKFWNWISPWIVEAPNTVVGYCEYEEYWNPSEVRVGDVEIKTGTQEDNYGNWAGS